MRTQLATELLKLRTIRGPWVAAGLVALFALAIPALAVAMAGKAGWPPLEPGIFADVLRSPAQLTGAVALLLGVIGTTGEFRHRTSVWTHLGEPRRGRVQAAKLAAYGAVGALLGAAATTSAAVVGFVGLQVRGVDPAMSGRDVWVFLAVPLACALFGVLGAAAGLLLRNPAVTVGVVLGWALVVESVVPVVTRHQEAASWLPTGASQALAGVQAGGGGRPGALMAAVVLAGYAGVLAGLARLADSAREV